MLYKNCEKVAGICLLWLTICSAQWFSVTSVRITRVILTVVIFIIIFFFLFFFLFCSFCCPSSASTAASLSFPLTSNERYVSDTGHSVWWKICVWHRPFCMVRNLCLTPAILYSERSVSDTGHSVFGERSVSDTGHSVWWESCVWHRSFYMVRDLCLKQALILMQCLERPPGTPATLILLPLSNIPSRLICSKTISAFHNRISPCYP